MIQQKTLAIYMAGREIPVTAEVEYFSSQDRMRKAAQAFGICWGAALVCVFVPVIHFVITPIALVAGPVAAVFVYFKVKALPKRVEGQTQCQNCQATTSFRFIEAKPPLFDSCQSCRTGYEVLWPPKEDAV